MAKAGGERSLKLIRSSGSTARVLNLSLVHQRFGDTPEYQAAPLFCIPTLNRSLLLKHVVRPSERDFFDVAPATTTKIILPFSGRELQLGGRSLFVGERSFERSLREISGGVESEKIAADIELVNLLNSVPSFDPFLLRERLRQSGYEPARCYFDLSEADVQRMREFVTHEIVQLVELAFVSGGAGSRDLARKLADKLLTDDTAKALDPLRRALQLSENEYREGVYSWKGFLYYRWVVSTQISDLPSFRADLVSARVNGLDSVAVIQLTGLKQRLVETLDAAKAKIEECLLSYGEAFAALAEGNANRFRLFLLEAPGMFVPLGEAIGALQHLITFWQFRFPAGRARLLSGDEAFELYSDFLVTLDGLQITNTSENVVSL